MSIYDNIETSEDIDVLNGLAFEKYLRFAFEKLGYGVIKTKAFVNKGIHLVSGFMTI